MIKKSIALPIALAVSLGAVLPVAPASAEPGGCVKYGAAGAVGGHLAHHGVLGAAGGCVTGMYVRHRYRKQQRRDAAAYRAEQQNGVATNGVAPNGATPDQGVVAPR